MALRQIVLATALTFQGPSNLTQQRTGTVDTLVAIVRMPTPATNRAEQWLDRISKASTPFAILIGGLFAYFKFARGRTFASRLVGKITTSVNIAESGRVIGTVSAEVNNVGAGRARLDFCTVKLLVPPDGALTITGTRRPEWREIQKLRIFEEHESIEAGEQVSDEIVFELPSPVPDAIRATLFVAGPTRFFSRRSTTWNSSRIIVPTLRKEHRYVPE